MSDTKLSRRQALEMLTAVLAVGVPATRALGQTTFERGAIVRTLLRDVPPNTISGPTLFHEHLSIRYPLTRAMAQAQGRDVPARFTGRVLDRVDGGDHTGFLLSPRAALVLDPAAASLPLSGASDIEAGHPA